jgi:methyltransferase (TIGR00027 family)
VARLAKGKASRTARMTAAMRARHAMGGKHPRVFDDRYARIFLDAPSLAMAMPTPISDWLFGRALGPVRALEGEVLARSRYVDEALVPMLAAGLDQVIILGAGFDTTALTHADSGARFFEVDHPATQAEKRGTLARHPDLTPAITFVPVDFAVDDLAEALVKAGLDSHRPALISWLGVVMYLEQDVTVATLTLLRKIIAPGSVILFDAYPRREEISADEQLLFSSARAFTAAMGEPMIGLFDSPAFAEAVQGSGWRIADIMTGTTMRDRWFTHQPRAIQPPKSALLYTLIAE